MSVRQRPAAPHAVAAAAGGESRLRAVLQAGRAHAAIGHPCGSNAKWEVTSETRAFDRALRNLDNASKMNDNDEHALGGYAEKVQEEYTYLKKKKQKENWFDEEVGPKWLEHTWLKRLRDIKARADEEKARFKQVIKILEELMNKV